MLALGIRYLTGYAVATDVANRDQAEWPPHPARVFMAMAAAMFETGQEARERQALAWLEAQDPPSLAASGSLPRSVVKQFVAVNDKAGPASMTLQCAPSLTRQKKERTFPCVRPDHDTVYVIWEGAEPDGSTSSALGALCAKVTRIGHSSSLVQMWVEDNPPEPNLLPTTEGEVRMRTVTSGTLGYLERQFDADAAKRFTELICRIDASSGKAQREAKKEYEREFGEKYKKKANPPALLRPVVNMWQPYTWRHESTAEASAARGPFGDDLLVLSIDEGPTLGLESTWRFLTALHKTILSKCDPAPGWLSGHTPDGGPSEECHAALMPLAFVGREHADGHLLGVALAMPKGVAPRDRGRALGGLLYDEHGMPVKVRVRAGSLGSWTLSREARPSPPLTLQPRTWTAPSRVWASVTPVVLDRHPKADRRKDRQAWALEVASIVADSCERQGLPRPEKVDIDKTSWHLGAPRAVAGKSAGFPMMPVKEGQSRRQQVHVWLEFVERVRGPVLLGAGRYRGYGVCRAWGRSGDDDVTH